MQTLINIIKWNQIKIRFDTWTNGSTNKKVFGAMMIVTFCTLLVKVAALLKDMLVAKTFGTGDAMDALLIAFLIPSFVINVFAGAIGNSLIPTYIQVRDNEGKTEAHELVSGTLVLALGLLVGMTLMFVLIGPYILPFLLW